MKHALCLAAVCASLVVGCSDFTPVQGALVNGGDGGGAGGGTFNGCTAEMFVDRSANGADRTIGFGGEGNSLGFSFAPMCMTIAAGQSVTWVGAFATHPLTPGVPGDARAGAAGNPIRVTMSGTTTAVTFPRAVAVGGGPLTDSRAAPTSRPRRPGARPRRSRWRRRPRAAPPAAAATSAPAAR
jgi:plastocyanin